VQIIYHLSYRKLYQFIKTDIADAATDRRKSDTHPSVVKDKSMNQDFLILFAAVTSSSKNNSFPEKQLLKHQQISKQRL